MACKHIVAVPSESTTRPCPDIHSCKWNRLSRVLHYLKSGSCQRIQTNLQDGHQCTAGKQRRDAERSLPWHAFAGSKRCRRLQLGPPPANAHYILEELKKGFLKRDLSSKQEHGSPRGQEIKSREQVPTENAYLSRSSDPCMSLHEALAWTECAAIIMQHSPVARKQHVFRQR